jgi:glycosyltransferase involved in cell wall biosynthesis
MRIALLGTRGVPARYGGSETAAEQIYSRLSKKHHIIVYCRNHMVDSRQSEYKGIKTIVLPSINTKSLDTISHSFLSVIDLIFFNRVDIVHFHGIGNSILIPILKLFNKKVVIGIDGMDWERGKWNFIEKIYLRLSLYFAVFWGDKIYVDSLSAQRFCKSKFNKEYPLISYGAEIRNINTVEYLRKFGLEKEKYILFVGRFIPEKGIHNLIKAYELIETDFPLVLVGDNLYNREYVNSLKSTKDKRIIFTGSIYGDGFWELICNCYFYVQPSEIEGTSPVLLSAMGNGRCVVVNQIPENCDVIGESGLYYKKNNPNDLAIVMNELLSSPDLVEKMGEKAKYRVEKKYNWDVIAAQTESLYESLKEK